jgi:hypothetical protein
MLIIICIMKFLVNFQRGRAQKAPYAILSYVLASKGMQGQGGNSSHVRGQTFAAGKAGRSGRDRTAVVRVNGLAIVKWGCKTA